MSPVGAQATGGPRRKPHPLSDMGRFRSHDLTGGQFL